MASINHYPAHKPEQEFTCEATAEVIGRTEGLPYLTTIFCDYVDIENTSHGLLTVNVQSKYPTFASQSARDKPAISFYADGYDNFRIHTSWKLTDSSTVENVVPYCYLDPVTTFIRNIIEPGWTLGTGLWQSGLSGTGLKYADEPIESYPHIVDDTTIGQFVVEKYGGYNYVCIRGSTFGRILLKTTSQWTTPATDSDLSEKRLVTHIKSRDDPTAFYYSSRILDFDYRIIYGESFSSGEEWLAWCKAH